MSTRRLGLGERGEVGYRDRDGRVTAAVYYRDQRGRRRRLEATAGSKAAARRAVLAKHQRATTTTAPTETTAVTLRELAEQWHARVVDLAKADRRSPTTVAHYRWVLDTIVLPELGDLRTPEVTVARLDEFIHQARSRRGYSAAKLTRSVLSGVCGMAVRRELMRSNPVRDISPLEQEDSPPARALTVEECARWLAIVDAHSVAIRKDLPDLVRFMLGTGARIGEALAVHWDDLDLDAATARIGRTVVRVRRVGLVAKRPKTRAGIRVLHLPDWLVQTLVARRNRVAPTGEALAGPAFASTAGGYRDRENVERAFRAVRAGTEFEWVVPHTYRKTVATLLDAQGVSARLIADQLGHSRVSMTQDVYLGRQAVDQTAATALNLLPAATPRSSPSKRT